MEEGHNPANPSSELYVVNNSFVNDYGSGTFIYIDSSDVTPAVIINNIFAGSGTVTNQGIAALVSNFIGDPLFNDAGSYDCRLTSGSPVINAGTDPGVGGGISLTPTYEYVHPACGEIRNLVGPIDIGAYEYGGAVTRCRVTGHREASKCFDFAFDTAE